MFGQAEIREKPLKPSEINKAIKALLSEACFSIQIIGEVSGFKPSASGHCYFSLKDDRASISAVMFRSATPSLTFKPKDGDLVIAYGSIDVYEPRGTYQLVCQSMRKAGEGKLLLEIEKRKAYYRSLGWFDEDQKKPIPEFPTRIGVVTALTGAAIHDIVKTTGERAPGVDVLIYPTLVQGEGSAEMVASRIRQANEVPVCDVLIVGRGGGSAEDLSAFSEDAVIKAIHKSSIPIISAVGHESDWAISDFVADARALTPTAGAVIATKGIFSLRESLRGAKESILSAMKLKVLSLEGKVHGVDGLRAQLERKASSYEYRLNMAIDESSRSVHDSVDSFSVKIPTLLSSSKSSMERKYFVLGSESSALISSFREIGERMERELREGIRSLSMDFREAMRKKATSAENRIAMLSSGVSLLSPKAILKRGYSIAEDGNGHIIKAQADVKAGDEIKITLHMGSIKATVTGG